MQYFCCLVIRGKYFAELLLVQWIRSSLLSFTNMDLETESGTVCGIAFEKEFHIIISIEDNKDVISICAHSADSWMFRIMK